MAAPLGNQFWRFRSKHGKDKIFENPEIMWEAACEYFEWCVDNPIMEVQQAKGSLKPTKDEEGNLIPPSPLIELPRIRPFTLQGLCRHLHINTEYFNQFEKTLKDKDDDVSKGYSRIIKDIRETIYDQKFSNAAAGFLNANLISRDLGLAEKSVLVGNNDSDLFAEKSTEELVAMLKEYTSKLGDGK